MAGQCSKVNCSQCVSLTAGERPFIETLNRTLTRLKRSTTGKTDTEVEQLRLMTHYTPARLTLLTV